MTFDFHETLVHCDDWFQLEVYRLPSAFLDWHNRVHSPLAASELGPQLDRAYRRLRTAILHHGHELSAVRSIALIFRQAGIPVSDGVVAEGVHALMWATLPSARAVEGAGETIRTLKAEGVELGVISSAVHHPFLEWALQRLGLSSAMSIITTSASAGYYKSRPELYWHTLAALDADPGRARRRFGEVRCGWGGPRGNAHGVAGSRR
jgi:FMN phosphatase YigB (HAD superfamily)